MKVLYEDNHVIVLIKPYNMPTQADKSHDPDVLGMVKDYLIQKYKKPGDAYVGLVSRLDRPCAGVMVVAKTSKAASRLTKAFADHKEIIKEYLAVVDGTIPENEGTYIDQLYKDRNSNTVKVVPKDTPGSKYAELSYKVLSRKEDKTLVKIRLLTGRAHQIRVQFASHGYPLFGDQKYHPSPKPHTQLALWSYRLTFPHPVKKEPVTVTQKPAYVSVWKTFEEDLQKL
ncbi:MAG: RluA family pseudouridine synthase [Erysipelotrichales bacterium]|nr:RluA family pseudouridine synthase [Erysipelotrichales bacterium]